MVSADMERKEDLFLVGQAASGRFQPFTNGNSGSSLPIAQATPCPDDLSLLPLQGLVHCQPLTPLISGRWWAMPLWQSIQVASPEARAVECI